MNFNKNKGLHITDFASSNTDSNFLYGNLGKKGVPDIPELWALRDSLNSSPYNNLIRSTLFVSISNRTSE